MISLPYHIGFTGTQHGMTETQRQVVFDLLKHRTFYARHGGCIGADKHFDEIVRRIKGCYGVIVHPSTIVNKRAELTLDPVRDVLLGPKPPLVRNQDIVIESFVMLATPKEDRMQIRSGTWATIRYAREVQKPMVIVMPNGMWISDSVPWPC